MSVAEPRAPAPARPERPARRSRACGSRGARFPRAAHSLALLLTDADSGDAVSLDYRKALSLGIPRGNLAEVRLRMPAGTDAARDACRAYVIADVFPLAARDCD